MDRSNGSRNSKRKTILKRALALMLALVLVTGLGLTYSADRVLEATSVPEESESSEVQQESSPAPAPTKSEDKPAKKKDEGLAHEEQQIVIEDHSADNAGSGDQSSAPAPAETKDDKSGGSQDDQDPGSGDGTGDAGIEGNEQDENAEAVEGTEAEENPEETEETEEEVKYPAQKLTAHASDGAKVTINAPEGALPEGSTVSIKVVSSAGAANAVDEMLGDDREVVSAKAYDITIHGPDGREIQPDESVKVSLTGAGVGSGDETELYHMQSGGAVKVTDVNGSSASFSASHFSVYVFVEINTEVEENAPAGIVLSDKIVRLESIGHYYQIEASFRGFKGNTAGITWASDDPEIASVDETGTVTAVSYGSTTVRASYTTDKGDEYTAEATVEVSGAEAVSMILNRNTVELNAGGETTTLGVTFRGLPEGSALPEVTWESSDESVVTVTDGMVTARGAGSAVITASAEIGGQPYSAKASVTIKEAEQAIRLSPETFLMKYGDTDEVEAVLVGLDPDAEVTWTTSNKEIVSVDANGRSAVIKATGVGRATVKARVQGKRGTLTAEASVKVSDSGSWSNGTSEMEWTVDEDGVLTVSGNGELKMSGQADGGFGKTTDSEGEIGDTPWKEWRNSITEVVVGEGVTTIGPRAFEGCQNLYRITFTDKESLRKIGFQAFYRCHKLIEIDLSGCVNLEELEGNGSDKGAFSHGSWRLDNYSTTVERSMIKIDLTGCTSLKTIGGGTFYGRRYIDFDMSDLSGLEVIGEGALEDKHEFNAIDFTKLTSLTELGTKALRNNNGVVVVDMSGNTNLTKIGYGAFMTEAGFTSTITTVDLSGCSGLKEIGASAFARANSKGAATLTTVDLSGTAITEIKDKTFQNQEALVSVSIPEGVKTINGSAFTGCTSIREITWDAKDYTANSAKIGDTFKSISDKSQLTVTIGPDVEKLPKDFFTKLDGASFVFAPSADGSTRTVRMDPDGSGYRDYIVDADGHIYLQASGTMEDVSDKVKSSGIPVWVEYESADDLVYNGENQNIIQTKDPGEGVAVQYKIGKNGAWNDVTASLIPAINAGIYEVYFRLVEAESQIPILEEQKALKVTVKKADIPVKVDTHALDVKPGDAYDFSNRLSGELPEGVNVEYSFGVRSSGLQNITEYYGSVDDFKSAGRTLKGSKYRAGTTTGVDVIVIKLKDTTGNYNNVIYKIPVRVMGDPRLYTVTFKTDAGSFVNDGGGKTYSVTGPAGTRISQPVPYREGYMFNGWNAGVPETIMRDVTFTAQWTKCVTVTLTAGSASKDYDGTPLTEDSVTVTGLPEGYTVEAHATGSQTEAGTGVNAVNDNYIIRDAQGNKVNGSFVVETVDGKLTVNKKSVVVRIKGSSTEAVYDGEEHSAEGYEVESISDPAYTPADFAFSGQASAAGTDAGSYSMGLKAEQFSNTNNNFDKVRFEVTDGSVTITPRPVTVTANNSGKAYGTEDPELTADVSGLIGDDTIEYSLEREAGEKAGEYAVTASGEELQGNYSVTYRPAVFTISKSEVLVIADNKSKAYGDSDPELTATVTGLAAGDDPGVIEYTVTRKEGEDAGTYEITPEGEAKQGNYTVRFIPAELVISRRAVTVRASDASKVYGSADPEELAAEVYGGLQEGDRLTYDVSRQPGEDVREGGYPITPSGKAVQGNYEVSYEGGTFTIVPLDGVKVTVNGNKAAFNYDGSAHAVSGYSVTSSDPLYMVGDIDFSGSSSLTATDATPEPLMMGLAADQFANNNPNFSNVEFIVNDGSLRIDPVDVTVNIIGKTATSYYNGKEHKITGYDVETGSDLYTAEDFEFSGTAEAVRTDAGRTYMGLEAGQFSNTNENFRTVTFNVTDGYQEITPADTVVVNITGAHDSADYDGKDHTVSGYTVSISDPLYTEDDFMFTPQEGLATDEDGNVTASRKDAGRTYMGLTSAQFSNRNANFSKVVFKVTDGYQEINSINTVVTVRGKTNNAVYDGEEHTVSGYTAKADTPLYNTDRLVFTGTAEASRTDAGTSNMGLTAGQFTNTDSNFQTVTVNVIDGYQTVDPASCEVKITGHSSDVTYDGADHAVSGYDVEITDELYKESDIEFSGEARASQKDAGKAYMGLTAGQFSNKNSNFANVTFTVTDGYQNVEPAEATVIVTGKNSIVPYDGTEHSVSGYDVIIEDPLYTEADFEFTGTADAGPLTDAGTVQMGLSADQFVNKNSNFGKVDFIVEDGYQTVEPIDATVTITGRSDTVSYDGKEHSVSGYDVEISGGLYTEADFDFTPPEGAALIDGTAGASRSEEGTTWMGLAAGQFVNHNGNFRNVTFNVRDGYQTIVPVDEVVVTITGHTGTADYDGKEHSVSGYDVAVSNDLYKESDIVFSGTDSASGENAGTTYMGLEPGQFSNKNANFAKVTFVVNDGWQKIEPINVTVDITGRKDTARYDGKAHSVSGYDVKIDSKLYKETDFVFDGSAAAARTEAGTSQMGLAADQFSNVNPNFGVVTFNVTDGYQKVDPIDVTVDITGRSGEADYDGKAHSVSGYDVVISDPLYKETDFVFDGSAVATRTDAGTTTMGLASGQFTNTNSNFGTVTFRVKDGQIDIAPIRAKVTVTGNKSEVDYDGQPHSVSGFTVSADTPLYDTETAFEFTGTAETGLITNAGTAEMGLSKDQFVNKDPNFSKVTFVINDGSITVLPITAAVEITGHTGISIYDGYEHSAAGYDVVISDPLYKASDFTFSGKAEAARTEEGTSEMGLEAGQFKNNNPNFSEVTFKVTDGYQTITPVDEVVVTVTGRKDVSPYDAAKHSVSGYDISISDPLYTVNDFTFSGTASAERTKAGKTDMGLEASQFRNKNKNFAKVTFIVTDGYQEISPIDAVVSIDGEVTSADYDGKEHKAAGYSVSISEPLYSEEDFTFSGEAEAAGTDAGTFSMGLAPDQFTNNNKNFGNVRFVVRDGSVTVRPVRAAVRITGNNNTTVYDGKEHAVSGYEVRIDGDLYKETDFTFSGAMTASRTDAGRTDMGLAEGNFANTNRNFSEVTFTVEDGYQVIEPAYAEVKITGRTGEAVYDGKDHAVSGYDVEISEPLYTEKDFVFSGSAAASRGSAGTSMMGLVPESFSNVNSNFANVVFTVEDGYQKIDPAEAVVTITGHTNTATYDGMEHRISGYDYSADDPLYDASCFSFTPAEGADLTGGSIGAARTDEGTTDMGLRPEQFRNTSANFGKVDFVVTDGYQKIIPAGEVTVTVRGHSDEVIYDGKEHSVSGYDISISDPLYTPDDFGFSGEAAAAGTDAGEYTMGLAADQFTNNSRNFSKVTFEVTDGKQTIRPASATVKIIGRSSRKSYNGKEHSVEGYTVTEMSPLYHKSDFTFAGIDKVSRTDAGTTPMGLAPEQFSNNNSNFSDVTFEITDGYMAVDPVTTSVKIIGKTGEAAYNGREHSVSGFEIVPADPLLRTGDIIFNGNSEAARTDAGNTPMGLTSSMFTWNNSNFSSVTFDVTDGGLTVTPVTATVNITGHSAAALYDRTEHSVSGYDAVSGSEIYSIDDFSFLGSATAVRTDAGTTMMGLEAGQFRNDNPNFSSVEFTVNDGYLRIDPVDVTVNIIGKTATSYYDGKEHKTTGYDVETGSDLYTTEDFAFSGSAEAVRTDAGRTYMGLEPGQFSNTNENFGRVSFNVTDGYQEITPADTVVVNIMGSHDSSDYDGKEHSVSGYSVSISDPLYTEDDFTFTPQEGLAADEDGNVTASRKDAGRTYMGLTSAQFSNKNANFSKVIFNVTDGYQEINSVNTVVTVRGETGTAVYDGKEHKVNGYTATADTPLYDTDRLVLTGTAEAVRTDAGTTQMGLTAGQFTNTDSNFRTVTVNVIDGYQTVDPAACEVKITGHTGDVTYDGAEHAVSGYDVEITGDLYKESDIEFTGSAVATQTDAGRAYMGLAAGQFSNRNSNFADVTFTVTDGYQNVEPAEATVIVTGKNSVVPYDGTAHSVSGYDVIIEDPLYTEADFEFTGTADAGPLTDAGTVQMGLEANQFVNRNSNFGKVDFIVEDGYQTVEPIDATVTITGRSDTVSYDGKEHSVSGYDVEISGGLYKEEDFDFTPPEGAALIGGTAGASRSEEGTTWMGLAAGQFANHNNNFRNVTFNVRDGYQTIVPVDEVVVTITGHTGTADYDGKEHSVSGYDVAVSNELYKETDIVFSGTDSASGENAGTTYMGLEPGQFSNKNSNFSKVTFVVSDGWQKIEPINVTVDVTGHSSTARYDGKAHSVSGYDVKIDSKLYKETDFVFDGSAAAARTDAGTSQMGLAADQFSNVNPNFGVVTFNVTDGYQKVDPIDVTVDITGHTGAADYDGKAHSVSGYDVRIEGDLYKETDFTFSGNAVVSRTDAGTTAMGLASGQFTNTNGNFGTVKFRVSDGQIDIAPIKATVAVTGNKSEVYYDGQPHSVSGFTVSADTPLYDTDTAFEFRGTAETGVITDAGTAEMGLSQDQFVNKDPNFSEVRFVISDGSVTVLPITAEVEITGHTGISIYDGYEHSAAGYDVSISDPLYKASDITFSGKAEASRTEEGTSEMGLEAGQFKNNNPNFSEVTFTVTDGYQTITPVDEVVVTVTGRKDVSPYDAVKHSVSGYDISISDPLYTVNDFTFSGTASAERTKAGKTAMGLEAGQFRNKNKNFAKVTFNVTDGYQEISPIDAVVSIDGKVTSADYDGKDHKAAGYSVSISEPLYSEEDFTFTGEAEAAGTDAGTVAMGLAPDQFTNNNKNFGNVRFVVRDGSVTVRPVKAAVKITGRNDTAVYDGKEHAVSGYDVEIEGDLYKETDFTFSGAMAAARTDAGRTDMGLTEASFANTNRNFSEVTFTVEDGYQVIEPATAEVFITGHTGEAVYDGKDHAVSGYDVEIVDPLYSEADFVFSGSAEASRGSAGTSMMGLVPESFRNVNGNFANVVFTVEDGYQKIDPAETVVTITGRTNTATYDGMEHRISGYDAVSADPLYDSSCFSFTPAEGADLTGGSIGAARTEEGTTEMGLKPEQFRNTSANFGKVEFVVTDGYQKIIPAGEVTVTVRGHSDETVYDGKEHSISGYDISISDPLYTPDDFEFSGEAAVSATDAGEYPMGLAADQFTNNSRNFSKVTFEVTDGKQTIRPASATVKIIGRSSRKSYNGKEHSVEGYTVAEMSPLYHKSDFTFAGSDKVSRTDAGTTPMGLAPEQFINNNSNFSDVTFEITDGYMAVDPVTTSVKIIGTAGEAAYDGREHSVSGFEIVPADPLLRTGDIIFNGNSEAARTDAGTAPMGLTPSMFTWNNSNFSSVTFDVTDGGMTVTPVTATVNITGHFNIAQYDRNEHSVSGYDAVSGSELYSIDDFSFLGSARAARTEAGTTMMGLEAGQFRNNNANFSEVTFNVTDGYQTLTEAGEVVVVVMGHTDRAVYDGRKHTVTGYDTQISDPLYTVDDFEFTGSAEASLTDAGEAWMDLDAEQFVNKNDNFSNVTFVVNDGGITVSPAPVVITAASSEREYNGLELSDSGYKITEGRFAGSEGLASCEVSGSQTLPGRSDNVITGYELLEGTKADNYSITLVPGTLTVTDRKVKFPLQMKANSGDHMYDGISHAVSGFETEEFMVSGRRFTVTGLKAGAAGTDAGIYDTELTGTAAVIDENGNDVTGQFDVTAVPGRLTIGRRTVILTSGSVTGEYSGDPLEASDVEVTGDGFAPGEGAEFKITGNQTIVGMAENLFTYVLNKGTKAENYDITVHPGTLTVTSRKAKYAITVKAENGTFKYDGTEKIVTGLQSSKFLAGGNIFTVSGLEAKASGVHAGTYPVVVTGTPVVKDSNGNDVSEQFSVTAENGEMEITKRTVGLHSASAEGVYDGNALTGPEVTVSGDGFAEGDGATYDVTGSRKVPGASENTFTYTLDDGTLASDYDISTYPGTLTVINRPDKSRFEITVRSAGGSAVYDGSEHTAGGLIDGITGEIVTDGGAITVRAGGHTYTITGLNASVTKTAAGTYPVGLTGTPVVTDEDGNDVSSEFAIHTDPGKFVIAKRRVVMTSASDTHAYNGKPLTAPDVAVTGDGFAQGEGAEFDVTGTRTLPGISSNTFTYRLTDATDAANYDITVVTGSLTITDRDALYILTLTPVSGEWLYDGSEKTVEGFVSQTAVIDGERYEVSGLTAKASGTDAGEYSVTITGKPVVKDAAGNDVTKQFAVVTEPGTLTIRPRSVILSSQDQSREYDGTPLEGGEVKTTGDGFVGEDGVIISGQATRTLVGVSENSFDWEFTAGTNPSNYRVSTVFGLISVTSREAKYVISLVANSDTVEYDGEEHSVSGFAQTEFDIGGNVYSVSGIESQASGTEAGVYGTEIIGDATVSDADGEDVTEEFAVIYESGSLTITAPEIAAPGSKGDGNGGAPGSGQGGSGEGSSGIPENTVPYAKAPSGYWALLNLIMMILTALLAVFRVIGWTRGKRDGEDDEGDERRSRKGASSVIGSAAAAVISVIAFFLTEDLSNTMALADRYTLLMALILLAGIVIAVLPGLKKTQEDDRGKAEAQ